MKKVANKTELPKSPIEIVFTVCNRGNGDDVINLLEANHIKGAMMFNGEGTWEKTNASLFSFGVVERDIVACVVESEKCKAICETLYDDFKLNLKRNGIVFSMALSSATLELLQLFGIGE